MIAAPDARAIARMMQIETDYLTPQAAELVDVARSLVPKLAARAAEVDANGIVHPESVREIHDAGLFRVLQPKRWGGHEMDPRVFYTIQMILAEGCMSTAWIYGVIGVHYWQLPLFTEQAQNDVWGKDPSTRIASTYMPVGKAEKVGGGWRFSGRWGFSSGCEYAEWIFLGGLLPKADGSGALEHCTFLLPKADYKIVKNWDVLGLRGFRQPRHVVEGALCPSTAPTAPTTTATPPARAASATPAGCTGFRLRRCSSARCPAPASARSTARSRTSASARPPTWASTARAPPTTSTPSSRCPKR
jgi:3-hydroxy-9,10-secoandrosta-1,3,5(10)-triene-9,17-dione monooxygenase